LPAARRIVKALFLLISFFSVSAFAGPIAVCNGKLSGDVSFVFRVMEDEIPTLDLKYFGETYHCLLKLQFLGEKNGPSVYRYSIQTERGTICRPRLSAELHHGLVEEMDLRVRDVRDGRFIGDIRVFEGVGEIPCAPLEFHKSAFEKQNDGFPNTSLRGVSSVSSRPAKAIERVTALVKRK
jgi:hypothetical protein